MNGASRKRPIPLESTALISFDDISLCNDSYFYNSRSSESGHAVAPTAVENGFPYWQESQETYREAVHKQSRALVELESGRRRVRLGHSLLLVFKNARATKNYNPNVSDDDIDDAQDDESAYFSISTDLRHPIFHPVNISVMTGDEPLPIIPSDASSVHTTRSTRTAKSEKSRMSLDQFLQEQQARETSSLVSVPINLGEIAANDGASVGSFLDVSFDEDYPQLVLTPSHDGTASRLTGSSTVSSNGTLGASYAHPSAASNRSVSSFETAKQNVSCTPHWLNENIDMVWRQIDKCKTDPNGDSEGDDVDSQGGDEEKQIFDGKASGLSETKSGDLSVDQAEDFNEEKANDHNEEMADHINEENADGAADEAVDADNIEDSADDSDDDDSDGETKQSKGGAMTEDDETEDDETATEPRAMLQKPPGYLADDGFDWVDDMVWSLSAQDSILSISNRIEKDVIHPILKPIVEFVVATEIPETARRGSKRRRPLKDLNLSPNHMTRRKPHSRVANQD